MDPGYFIARMPQTVISIPIDGIDLSDEGEIKKIEKLVEDKVKAIIDVLNTTHEKFSDQEFGPTDADEFGAIALYGTSLPAPSGTKYPPPDSLCWVRPNYDDENFKSNEDEVEKDEEGDDNDEEDEFAISNSSSEGNEAWCKHGKLFLDGSSSGDVIQGQLGDCWFLGALAVMGAHEELLTNCFWRSDSYRAHGIFVVRFFKDCKMVFVIIDDKIPIKVKDRRVIFAACKDTNELWVPLIEKAYAKLHGSYKALIGGYSHYALADMTNYLPRSVVLKPGFTGYSDKFEPDEVWAMIMKYRSWNCLMGCSIQSNPKENHKVEAEAGMGLFFGHAYSLLDAGVIKIDGGQELRMVKLRNPWGRGEWEGPFGDRSDEREKYDKELTTVFGGVGHEEVVQNFNDGTFFITFDEWLKNYSSLFLALNFPKQWTCKRSRGVWSAETGGNRSLGTWMSNPRIKFRINSQTAGSGSKFREVFVGLYIRDSRMTLGFDYCKDPLYATPLTFDIVTAGGLQGSKETREFAGYRSDPSRSKCDEDKIKQAPYNFGSSQVELFLEMDVDYYIVPSLYKRGQAGTFYVTVAADCAAFELEGGVSLSSDHQPMTVGKGDKQVTLKMSAVQFYEKREGLRQRITSEAKRLGISLSALSSLFSDCAPGKGLTFSAFKRRMISMNFSLADLPDDDLEVLDEDFDGTVSPEEFIKFIKEGMQFEDSAVVIQAPPPPVDDLMFKAVDLEGVLTVDVLQARELRLLAAWFSENENSTSDNANKGGLSKKIIKYDKIRAAAALQNSIAASHALQAALAAKRNLSSNLTTIREGEELNDHDAAIKNNGDVALGFDSPMKNSSSSFGAFSPLLSTSNLRSFDALSTSKLGGGLLGSILQADDARSVRSGGAMSVSLGEATKKAGQDAAAKLHSDIGLQKAEESRTKNLARLRNARNRKDSATKQTNESSGVLRRKSKPSDKPTRRDIHKDKAAMLLLGICTHKEHNHGHVDTTGIRKPMSMPTVAATPAVAQVTVAPPQEQHDVLLARDAESQQLAPKLPDHPVEPTDVAATVVVTTDPAEHHDTPESTVPQHAVINSTVVINRDPLLISITATETPPVAAQPQQRDHKSEHRHHGKHHRDASYDLWDMIIDSVIMIAESRPRGQMWQLSSNLVDGSSASAGGKSIHRNMTAQSMAKFNIPKSPLPAPTTAMTPSKLIKGSAATPRNQRRTPGKAAISIPQSVLGMKQASKTVMNEAKGKLSAMADIQNSSYDEVYRRLISIPMVSSGELEGDRVNSDTVVVDFGNEEISVASGGKNALIRRIFAKFDKNGNGLISPDEFTAALKALKIDMMPEETATLFNRFETREKDGNIDWTEFLDFFSNQFSEDYKYVNANEKNDLLRSLLHMRDKLSKIALEMTSRRIFSLEELLAKKNSVQPVPTTAVEQQPIVDNTKKGARRASVTIMTEDGAEHELPENAIFNSLASNQAEKNSERLRKIGLKLTSEEMSRISRIFGYSVKNIMEFVLSPDLDLFVAVQRYNEQLLHCFQTRGNNATSSHPSNASSSKLWNSLASNLASNVSFDDLSRRLVEIIEDALHTSAQSSAVSGLGDHWDHIMASPSDNDRLSAQSCNQIAPVATASKLVPTPTSKKMNASSSNSALLKSQTFSNLFPQGGLECCHILGVRVDVLSRLIVDSMTVSAWNKPAETGSTELINSISYTGFESFMRNSHINALERKLRYLIKMEMNSLAGSLYMLVHVFFSRRQDEFIVLCYDPISGEVHKLQCFDDLTDMPMGHKLQELFPRRKEHLEQSCKFGGEMSLKVFNEDSTTLYNPWDTPVEEQAVSEMLARLRLVKGTDASPPSLILAEDPKFVAQLKSYVDVVQDVPFFCAINDLTICFDVAQSSLTTPKSTTSIEKIVFGSIRQQKQLYNFLTNVSSSLRVVLSSYNAGMRVALTWGTMLSYLGDQRNPFVTVQLLPRFLEPQEYLYVVDHSVEAFTGEVEDDPLAVQRSSIDIDGGSHPTWRAKFDIQFRPPKLTACKVISTEIAKMRLGGALKYTVVMLREGALKPTSTDGKLLQPEQFYFLTLYDPRSATEYQCGVQAGCALYNSLYAVVDPKIPARVVRNKDRLPEVLQELSEAADHNQLILGPAITPRLSVQVYNKRERQEELLGQCQLSVSSVLSGSAVTKPEWNTLTFTKETIEGDVKKVVDLFAGELQVDMQFRKQADIDAEIESEKERRKRQIETSVDNETPTTTIATKLPVTAPAAKPAVSASGSDSKAKSKALQEQQEMDRLRTEKSAADKALVDAQAQLSQMKSELTQTKSSQSAVKSSPRTSDTDNALLLGEKSKWQAEKDELAKQLAQAQILSEKKLAQILAESTSAKEQLSKDNEDLSRKHAAMADEVARLREEHARLQQLPQAVQAQSQAVATADLVTHDGSVEGVTAYVLNNLIMRHEKKMAHSSHDSTATSTCLDVLTRMLRATSSEIGITAKDFVDVLEDLLLDVTIGQAEALIQRISTSSTRESIPHQTIMTYFKRQLALLNSSKTSSKQMKATPSKSSLKAAADGSSSAATLPRSSGASGTVAAETAAEMSVDKSKASGGGGGGSSGGQSPSRVNIGLDVPVKAKETRRPVSAAAARSQAQPSADNKPTTSSSSSASAGAINTVDGAKALGDDDTAAVDWDTAPVPPNWERRAEPKSKKIYYVNHELKSTQWHHPLDKSKANKKRSVSAKQMDISTSSNAAASEPSATAATKPSNGPVTAWS